MGCIVGAVETVTHGDVLARFGHARRHGVRLSVGRRGQCWDNAVAESFFATIKTELIHRQAWPTRNTARQAIFEYIEGWYTPPAFQPRLPEPCHLRKRHQGPATTERPHGNLRINTSTLSVESGQAHYGITIFTIGLGRFFYHDA